MGIFVLIRVQLPEHNSLVFISPDRYTKPFIKWLACQVSAGNGHFSGVLFDYYLSKQVKTTTTTMKKAAFYIFLMSSIITFAGCVGSAYVGSPAPYDSYYPYYPYAPMRTQVIVVPQARHRWGYGQQGYRRGQYGRGYDHYRVAPSGHGNPAPHFGERGR